MTLVHQDQGRQTYPKLPPQTQSPKYDTKQQCATPEVEHPNETKEIQTTRKYWTPYYITHKPSAVWCLSSSG